MTPATPPDAPDAAAVATEWPIGEAFVRTFAGMSRDALRARQEARFRAVMAFAWRVPFYRRLWSAAGLEPGDVRSLDDLPKLPTYTKADLMAAVEAHPPFGDFAGLDAYPPDDRPTVVLQATAGTTGRPQPVLWGPRGRTVHTRLLARALLFQGLTRADVVHSTFAHGLADAGHAVREAIHRWVGALLVTAGSAVETRSRTQVALMRDFRASVLLGPGDYLKRLADVARENGIAPGRDVPVRMISGQAPRDRDALSRAWGGAPVFDAYGVGDTGLVAAEGPERDGLHVAEDAHFLEILDPETGGPAEPGRTGRMVVTCLYRDDVFPVVRFDTQDLTRERTDPSPAGLVFRRIAGVLGRSDSMVKLRGVNVYPEAIGAILAERLPRFTGAFVCRIVRRDGHDAMIVLAEVEPEGAGASPAAVREELRARLGIDVGVELLAPGALEAFAGEPVRAGDPRVLDERIGR